MLGDGTRMLTNLYFVRHAHSTYTPDERQRPLSPKGEADAEKITKILINQNIDVVISSPYKRAIQTVEGVSQILEKEMIMIDGFKERTLSDGPVKDFNSAIHKVWENPSFYWEGGESNLLAQERGVKATLEILEQYKGNNIVIGTHGNIMVLIMNYFDPKYGFHFWKELGMPDIYQLTFKDKKLKEVHHLWNQEVHE
jgi:2,3-bisphosphoglycerate-dependent phosphoglycerate mutase